MRPTVHSGAHGEHTLIYLLYMCMYVCLYTPYIYVWWGARRTLIYLLYIGGGIVLYRWGITNYLYSIVIHTSLYVGMHILLYTYYISLCVINIYKGMCVQPDGKQEAYLMGCICLTIFVAARAYRVCEAVVSNETVTYRANCELLFVVVV